MQGEIIEKTYSLKEIAKTINTSEEKVLKWAAFTMLLIIHNINTSSFFANYERICNKAGDDPDARFDSIFNSAKEMQTDVAHMDIADEENAAR